jgi:hypothetical protein
MRAPEATVDEAQSVVRRQHASHGIDAWAGVDEIFDCLERGDVARARAVFLRTLNAP